MVTKPKSNSVVSARVVEGGIVFDVLNTGKVTLDLTRTSQAVKDHAMLHGLVQRVSDAAAIPCSTVTGKSASPAEKFAAISALVGWYNSGTVEWRKPKVGAKVKGGRGSLGGAETPLILKAMEEVYGLSPEAMREKVEGLAAKYGIDVDTYCADALRVSAGAQADRPVAKLSRVFNALRGDKGMASGPVDGDDLMAELSGGV